MLPQSASSDSLGFRPPQFSDDVAWLPAWLQPHVTTTTLDVDEVEKDPQKHGGCSVKDMSQSRGNERQDKDPCGLLVKDIRKEGLRLHLSGDDDSPLTGTSCREKVLFTFHLSTDGSSGSCYFPRMEISQDDGLNSVEPRYMQSVKDTRGTEETKQSNRERNLGNMNLFSSTCNQIQSTGPSSQIQCSLQDAIRQSQRKPNNINSEDCEISDAVELSTAASEALVIYELKKSESSSDKLSTIDVLELSLQVKQTRLQWLNDVFTSSNSNDSTSSSKSLSELDDSDMEDAYEDVGLSPTSSASKCNKGTSVSHVRETPNSKQHFGEDGTVGNKLGFQYNNMYESSPKKQIEMLQTDVGRENLMMNEEGLDLIPSIACGDDLMTHQLHPRNSDDTKSQQEDAFRGEKHRKIKHLEENLTETSYVSESVDIAPDLNSCVHKHDGSFIILQSSILCRTVNNVPPLSEDIAKDPSLSLDDPLYSVIPCSISTRTHDCLPARSYDDGNHNYEKVLMPDYDKNMHTTSCLKDEIVCREKQDKPGAKSSHSWLNQRHTASLDAHNMQSPGSQPSLLQNDSNHIHAPQPESETVARSISCKRKNSSVSFLQNGHDGSAPNGAGLHISLHNEQVPFILCRGARHRVHPRKHPISTENEKRGPVDESLGKFDPSGILQNPYVQHGNFPDICIPTIKRVRFTDDAEYQKKRDSLELTSIYRSRKVSSSGKRKLSCYQQHCLSSQEVKEHLTNYEMKDKKKPIFQGLDFLLTGFACKKEKEIEWILRRYGGAVLADIPSPRKKGGKNIRSNFVRLPVVICTKKLQTRKFLYGCAVNAFLLQVDWVTDSIEAGYVILPEKYMILPNQQNRWVNRIQKPVQQTTVDRIFYKVGIMLHGEHGFCFELAEVIKHGQGRVYKTLQGLVQSLKNKNISIGIIVAENETYAARHLRKCASEQRIPMMSTSWVVNSIYNGKLLPFEDNNAPSRPSPIKIQAVSASQQWTQEI